MAIKKKPAQRLQVKKVPVKKPSTFDPVVHAAVEAMNEENVIKDRVSTVRKKVPIHPQLREVPIPGHPGKFFLERKPGIKAEKLEVEARLQLADRARIVVPLFPRYVDKNLQAQMEEEAKKRQEAALVKSREKIAKMKALETA